MDTLLTILQYILPAGGVGAMLTWLVSRRIRQAETDHKEHSVYKEMVDDMRSTLDKQSEDLNRLHLQVLELMSELAEAKAARLQAEERVNYLSRRIRWFEALLSRSRACNRKGRCPVEQGLAEGILEGTMPHSGEETTTATTREDEEDEDEPPHDTPSDKPP